MNRWPIVVAFVALGVAAAAVSARAQSAQSWPQRIVRFVAPFGPGSAKVAKSLGLKPAE